MKNNNLPPTDPTLEAQLRKRESDLYMANHTIVELMEQPFRGLLQDYQACESRADSYAWIETVAGEVIRNARTLTREEGSYHGPRAYCPLCREGSTASYDVGYSIPEGLRRHLIGWGNAPRCRVMSAALAIAGVYWDDQFQAQEKTENELRLVTKQKRLESEVRYQTTPNAVPQLLDANKLFFPSRTSEQLAWAESRLLELGFQTHLEASVKAYVDDRDELIIYADPTREGRIEFRAYKKPLPKRGVPSSLATYEIRDRWKNDLKAKYEDWVQRC